MKKQVKILTTAALLAMAASFTSLAAQTYDWEKIDGEWACYDEDGNLYEDAWCKDGGKEYYVDGDGWLGRSQWVDGGEYYANSEGQKVVSAWKYLQPYGNDDADEQWFYFDKKGEKVTNSKLVYEGKTYYFDSEGYMITGWVDKTGNNYASATGYPATAADLVYTDENGARVSEAWIEEYVPGDTVEDDLVHYYIKKNGSVQTGKANDIGGKTYFFDANGEMLSGWVGELTATPGTYDQINADATESDTLTSYSKVYFCDVPEKGYAKKNRWVKTYAHTDYYKDDTDCDTFWYWADKAGVIYMPAANDTLTKQTFTDGYGRTFTPAATTTTGDEKILNNEIYFFNTEGKMQKGLFKDASNNVYYYNADGEKTEGKATIEDSNENAYKFYFGNETDGTKLYTKYVGVTGAKNGCLYDNGLLMTAKDNDYEQITLTIGGGNVHFIVNKNGTIQTAAKDYQIGDGTKYVAKTVAGTQDVTFNTTHTGALKGSYTVSASGAIVAGGLTPQ